VDQGVTYRRPEDADAHRRDRGVEPRRAETVPIVENASVGRRRRAAFPAVRERPGRRRVVGDGAVHEPATAHRTRHDDGPPPDRRGHRAADVAGDDSLRVGADERGPPRIHRPAPAGPAGHGAAAERPEQVRGAPLLAPRRIAASPRADQLLEVRHEAGPTRPGSPAPTQAERLPVPADPGCRLDDCHGLRPGAASGQPVQMLKHHELDPVADQDFRCVVDLAKKRVSAEWGEILVFRDQQ
jgi:hypothetical protein